MMMARRWITGLVFLAVMAQGWTPLNAQPPAPVSMQDVYAKVFNDSGHREIQSELIRVFERHFTELVDDIKNTATQAEEKALIQFLKGELNHLADLLPMMHEEPKAFEAWVRIKQMDFKAVILGRKIQAIRLTGSDSQALETHQKNLKALLAEVLEAKLAKEQKDIAALENRLKELKRFQQIRRNNKDKILQNRYDELIGRDRLFRW